MSDTDPDLDLREVFRLLYEEEDDWGTFDDDEVSSQLVRRSAAPVNRFDPDSWIQTPGGTFGGEVEAVESSLETTSLGKRYTRVSSALKSQASVRSAR